MARSLEMAKRYTNGVPEDSDQSGGVADKNKRNIIETDSRYHIRTLNAYFHLFCAISQLANE